MDLTERLKQQWQAYKTWIVVGVVFFALFILLRLFPTTFFSYYVEQLCEWVASMGVWAPFILGLIDAVGVAICFPLTLAFELAAGFLFGVTAGTIVISVAKTFGAAAALLLGRTLLNRWVQNVLKNYPQFTEVYATMGKDTFKLAILLRLSPVPSWVNNYGLALTPISYRDFFVATIAAGFPGVLRNVYIGSLMKSVSAPAEGDSFSQAINLIMGVLTIIATVVVTKYLYKYLKMAMDKSSEKESEKDDLESNEPMVVVVPPSPSPTPPASPAVVVYPASPLASRQRNIISAQKLVFTDNSVQ